MKQLSVLGQLSRVLSHTLSMFGNVAEAGDVASSVLITEAEIYKQTTLKELTEAQAKLP